MPPKQNSGKMHQKDEPRVGVHKNSHQVDSKIESELTSARYRNPQDQNTAHEHIVTGNKKAPLRSVGLLHFGKWEA
ncbi:hypothetical protein A1332_06595 [Methylomonas methanica]|uniref:Uncharacterized protein n=1 Tax=Methylomonas methanica TaxID=421 RepID=A0A177MS63_METMH|nr:hypothetical protein A1332_06595 [Methylomonas methanica]